MNSPPDKIGKYQIISTLGKGGMGIVYKAMDPDIKQEVALKVIRPELLKEDSDGAFLKRFRNEVVACRMLKHPNIVATYDYHESKGECYIVMEYIDGKALADYLNRREVFDFAHIYKIIKQLLSVLSYAHSQEIIHRDIKPDNILIKEDGSIHVMDFGIARLNTSTLTVAGTVMGSPGYMAPEQCLGKQVDNRCDIFSAGVVLYELIAGERPFVSDNPMLTMQKILHSEPVKVSILNNNISSSFDLVIDKALAKIPNNRYQSAGEFLKDIDDFYDNYLKRYQKSKSKKSFFLAGIVIVIVIAVAGVGYFYKDKLLSDSGDPADNSEPTTMAVDLPSPDKSVYDKKTIITDVAPTISLTKLTAELDKFNCSTLQAKQDKNKKFNISGTVQTADTESLQSVLDELLTGSKYSSSVTKLDMPFCAIASALGDGVKLNQSSGRDLKVQPYNHEETYIEGELIMFEVLVPAGKAYLYVDYFGSDGSVVHLHPSTSKENQLISGPTKFVLGDKDVKWEVAEPFGTDLITIVSLPRPLFKSLRPNVEDGKDYLKSLKNVLNSSSMQQSHKADYLFLTTKAK